MAKNLNLWKEISLQSLPSKKNKKNINKIKSKFVRNKPRGKGKFLFNKNGLGE